MSSRGRTLLLAGALVVVATLLILWMIRGRDEEPTPHAPAPSTRTTSRPEPAPAPAPVARPSPPAPHRLTPAEVTTDATLGNGAFEGQVVSTTDGAGVPGAELTFSLESAAFTTRTDRQGRFTFGPPRPGTYRLAAVTATGFLPYAPEWGHSPIVLTAQPGARIQGVRLFLSPAQEYLGRVIDPSGQPVPGAEVRILDAPGGELALAPLPSRFESDAKGEVRLRAPDDALIEARHPDFLPGRGRVDLSVQASRALTLRLGRKAEGGEPPPPERITGQVRDPSGQPVEGALVIAEPASPNAGLRPSPQVTSDADGRFSLEGLDRGTYRLTAVHAGYVPARADSVPAGATGIELRLSAGARLSGLVRDARTGEPVPSFTVEVSRRQGLSRLTLLVQAVMDPRGRYEVTVPPGELAVVVAASGYGPSNEVPVTVTGTSPAVADVLLTRGGRVFGTVVDEKTRAPLAAARISVEGRIGQAASAMPVVATAISDARGQFSLEGVAAGLRSVQVAAAGHHTRILSGLQVQADGSIGPLMVELAPTEEGEEPRIELVGIGAVLQPQGEALVVVRTLPGGGAAEAGIGPGDLVLRVDGQEVTALGFEQAIQRIRGIEGSTVHLTVRRAADASVRDQVVTRRRIRG